MTRIYRERMDESRSISASEYSAKLKNIDRLLDKSQQYRAPKDSAIHARFFRPSCRSVNIGMLSRVYIPVLGTLFILSNAII